MLGQIHQQKSSMQVNRHLDSTHIARNARGAAGHSRRCWAW